MHGGKRNGSGRKKGEATTKTREVAERATKEGITPLEIMIEAMRKHYAKGELSEAVAIAKDAAPYMHPRLGAVQVANAPGSEPLRVVFTIEGAVEAAKEVERWRLEQLATEPLRIEQAAS